MAKQIDWAALAAPFALDEIKWRQQGKISARGYIKVLTYIDARAVADRLDEVVGPARWRNTFKSGVQGGLICRIEILVFRDDGTSEWVWREDGAENTDIEGVKGGMSSSFKRAAVQFGIGRYLYRLDARPVRVVDGWAPDRADAIRIQGGKGDYKPYHTFAPRLPDFAIKKEKESPSEAEVRRGKHEAEWENGGRGRFMQDLTEIMGKEVKAYDALKRYLHQRGGTGKPSTKSPGWRTDLLEKLRKQPETVNQIISEFKESQQGAAGATGASEPVESPADSKGKGK